MIVISNLKTLDFTVEPFGHVTTTDLMDMALRTFPIEITIIGHL